MVKQIVNIAIVEDDVYYNRLFEMYVNGLKGFKECEDLEFLVCSFTSGKKVIEFLETVVFDIVILDYYLQNDATEDPVNGDKVLEALMKKNSDCKVVVVSEQDDIKTTVEMLQLGAYDYISKGAFSTELLMNVVRKILIRKYDLF